MIERDSNGTAVQVQGAVPWTWPSPKKHCWFLVPLLLSACVQTGDKGENPSGTGGNHPPVIRALSIQPTPLILSGPLSALVQAQDEDGDVLTFRYRWFANGKLVADRSTETIEPGLFKRGDKVVVEVIPSDSKDKGASFKSETAVVGNTPPMVSHVTIEPDEQSFARRVVVKADVSDPDGDTMTVVYRWRKNDEVVKEGEANELDITGFSAKDSIQVNVMASDGIDAAKPVASQVFLMNNTAPKIISSPTGAVQNRGYEYQVQVHDLDGDPIAFELEIAPPGMTIHSQTGLVQWTPGVEAKGTHHVRVVAKDPKGGFAAQEFDLSLTVSPKS